MADSQSLAAKVQARFGEKLLSCITAQHQVTIEIAPSSLTDICTALRDEEDFAFEILMDLCGVDYSCYGATEWVTEASTNTGFSRGVSPAASSSAEASSESKHFAVVYHLLSIKNNQRIRVRVFAENNDFPLVDSVVPIWNCANWYEREAFDLFGIMFEGHPDLRRILSDYGFIGHPFRKDFPLSGHVEMRYDPEKGRVIYQPVSIEPRVLVPRVIREDHRYDHEANEEPRSDA